MTNIDLFRKDANIGDVVTIELTSGKSITGKVLEISDYVLVETDNGKIMRLLDGIIGGWSTSKTKGNIDIEAYKEGDTKKEISHVSENDEEAKNTLNKKVIKAGDKIPLDEHYKIDPSLKERRRMTHLGNSFESLTPLLQDSKRAENEHLIQPLGKMRRIGNKFAFLVDDNTKANLFVPLSEMLEEDIAAQTPVLYTITKNEKGPTAESVHKAGRIKDSLMLAEKLAANNEGRKAVQVLRHILDAYPNNIDATDLMDSFRRTFKQNNRAVQKLSKSNNLTESLTKVQESDQSDSSDEHKKLSKPSKPQIIESLETVSALPLSLPKMSDIECREKERELDALIRNGQRDECLEQSYSLLSKYCPTPKYLKSYLDRIVNTEIALDHTQEAINALAQLIYFSELQEDTKSSNLSHLYVSLGRLFKQTRSYSEASKALDCAEYLGGNSVAIKNLRAQISEDQITSEIRTVEGDDDSLNLRGFEDESAIIVSKMLQQDVEQGASTMNFADTDPNSLLQRAQGESSPHSNKTFDVKAQFFLEAAAAYWLRKEDSKKGYKIAVANYARMKGNAMYMRLQNTIHMFPENKDDLLAYSDSACSYFTEALGIFNELSQRRYLQELFLKYLKLRRVSSQILGGKTPDSEWHIGTLKALLKECLSSDNPEDLNSFIRTCIAVGSSAEAAWNNLNNDPDGIGPFTGKLGNDTFKSKIFKLFNEIEQSDLPETLESTAFLHSIFDHRQLRNKQLHSFLIEIIQWQFDPVEIKMISEKWNHISDFYGLLLPSDSRTCGSISKVLNILSDYVDGDASYRNNLLFQAQLELQKSIKAISDTTTYLGRVFFYHIENQWLESINELISLFSSIKEPKVSIVPDPATIQTDGERRKVFFRVINTGGSPAASINIRIIDKEGNAMAVIPHNNRLSNGDEYVVEWDLTSDLLAVCQQDHCISLILEATPSFQGRPLSPFRDVFIFEEESKVLLERKKIPWRIEATPPENIFKGRDKELSRLEHHYKSNERGHTYILFGLTRTGKTSILEYLRSRLNGAPLDERPDMTIIPFQWDFNKVVFDKEKENQFWENLVITNLYDALPSELKQKVKRSYDKKQLPEIVTQNDFLKIIDILNDNLRLPFFTIDEFSNVKHGMGSGMLNASFLGILRDLALTGKACFIYAGTYDIKELPSDPKYGYTGQLAHTKPMPVNAIEDPYANELIDAWEQLIFEDDAKAYIRYLSGCVPYWIQWICLNCGKYAVISQKHHIGIHDVDEVVSIMTGESRDENDLYTWGKIDEINFQNNQVMTDDGKPAEEALISSIAYINRDNRRKARGVSIKELETLWSHHNVSDDFKSEMISAIKRMKVRGTITEETEENRLVYRLSVDLFRRCWYINHKNINTELAHK